MADLQQRYQTSAQGRTGVREGIDEGLRTYMLRVYNLMALGIAVTALTTITLGAFPEVLYTVAAGPMKWVLFAGVLGLGWFAPKLIFNGNLTVAHGAYWLYTVLWGALIAPMVLFYLGQAPGIVAQAFFITAATFGSMSLLGYTTKTDLSPMGTFLFMAVVGLLIAIVVNAIFFQSAMMSLITSGVVVLIFSALTAYETQMIKHMYLDSDEHGVRESKAIFGAFALYGSFITLFIHILNILGIMRE
jgi:FtsH-binding integral membrane protein